MANTGPLAGIRILDFTHVLSGPFGSALLGDLGADIIKIESPVGDSTRWAVPPIQNGESSYFFCVNRNKRSMILDLKKPESKAIVKRMVKDCDVVMENFRPGVMDRLGMGQDALTAIKPDLIYASMTAFGEKGPYKDLPGYELIIQAMTGLIDITSPKKGPKAKIQIQVVDLCTGIFLAFVTLAALYHKLNTGKGQRVDTSLLESTLAMTANLSAIYFMSGNVPTGMASRNPQSVPSQVYRTKDSCFATVGKWEKLVAALGKPEWATDPQLGNNMYRVQHYDAVSDMVEEVTMTKTTEEWLVLLKEHDMPASRINTMEEGLEDPGVAATGMIKTVEHTRAGQIKLLDKPWHMSGSPGELRYPPPAHGQHSTEILKEFGYTSEEIQTFKEAEALYGE
ncbi:MAG: CoA transferase [Deltaproteobacteria bacterium]|nr:CoA transferase [Deltaproteobacteria bacterium]